MTSRTYAWILIALMGLAPSASASVILYTAESPHGWSHLYSIDTATLSVTDRGEITARKYITDIALDTNGTLYGVGWTNRWASNSKLYELTLGDADTSAQWANRSVFGRLDRTVNAAEYGDDALYVASNAGGFQKLQRGHNDRWEVVASGSLGRGSAGDLAFGPDGTLYTALAGGKIGTVNYDSDSRHFGEADVLFDTGHKEIYGLTMSDGLLYGLATTGNYTNSTLMSIDPVTGATTELADLGVPVWGATDATRMLAPVVPEPATMVLIGSGAALILLRRRFA